MSIKKSHVTELDKVLGQKLKNLRYQHNLSQNNIAKLLGVSAQQIQKYENGTNRLSLSSFIVLAKELKINVNEFLDIEEQQAEFTSTISSKHITKLTHLLPKLNCEALHCLVNFVEHMLDKN